MKVGIITDAIDLKTTGIGVYAHNLINSLNIIDKKNEYYLIHYMKTNMEIYKSNKEVFIPMPEFIPFRFNTLWRDVILPLKLKNLELDLLHDPRQIGFPPLFSVPFKTIITIADLMPMLFPKLYSVRAVMRHKLLGAKIIRSADRIIAISESTKRDLINYLKAPEEKIRVIYLAAGNNFKQLQPGEVAEFKHKYNLDFPFILFVGLLHPPKNIPRLIRAYHKISNPGLGHKLVIAGKKGPKCKEIFETAEKLNLQREVIFTGYIPDDDLPRLYNAADLFVFPSLYEGFGMPPLEAMACGTPVITSNTSSLPEVVGDAGITLNPYDVDGLARAMQEVLTNDRLRLKMVKKGLEQAKKFSWEKAAKETLRVYESMK